MFTNMAGHRGGAAASALSLAMAPFAGLLYALFLPVVGIAMIIFVAAEKIIAAIAGAAGMSFSFGWRPEEAYLTGKRKKSAKEGAAKHETK